MTRKQDSHEGDVELYCDACQRPVRWGKVKHEGVVDFAWICDECQTCERCGTLLTSLKSTEQEAR